MNAKLIRTVIELYEDGFDVEGIASSLGVPKLEAIRVLKRSNAKRRGTAKVVTTPRKLYKIPLLSKEKRVMAFEYKRDGLSSVEIAKMLKVPEDSVLETFRKDQSKIVTDDRASECLELYKQGYSLQSIGDKFKISRERVRQITKKQFAYDLGYGPMEQKVRDSQITEEHRSLVRVKMSGRMVDNVVTKLQEAKDKGVDPQYFDSFTKFTQATGISKENLKKYKPDTYKTIEANLRRKNKRWSWYYDSCRSCGTTSIKHRSYGYCMKCHSRSPEFKALQQRSHMKHRDTILENNKKYAEEYYSRPDVAKRMEQNYDNKFFGGNRIKALERDGYKCLGCGMSVSQKDKLGRSKVRVSHIHGTDDHSLENLKTYCQSCLFRYEGYRPHANFGKGRRKSKT